MFSLGALEKWNKRIDSNIQVWSHVYQNQILKNQSLCWTLKYFFTVYKLLVFSFFSEQ